MAREGVDGAIPPTAECKGENGREVVEVALPVRAIDVDPATGTGVFEREGGEIVKSGLVLAGVAGCGREAESG